MSDRDAPMSTVEQDVLTLLHELVAIDSVNPSLVPGAAGEGRIARHVRDWAAREGLLAEVVERTPGRPSVVVRPPGRDPSRRGRPTLLLCGHLDTVGRGAVPGPPLPRVEGDRLYGRGAYDMKAGLAAALIACREAAREDLPGEVVVAAVADEEHASLGIQDLLPGLTADAAIVTEPSELMIGLAHKGFVWLEIEVLGRAAHGSRPHLGVDAIVKTGPLLVALEELGRSLATAAHPLLGPGTVHASLISGGQEESTVPARCVLTVERRTLPGETPEDIEREIGALLRSCQAKDPEFSARARVLLSRPAMETSAEQPLVRALGAAAGEVLGRPVETGGLSFWADSAFLAGLGIPTVLFGPDGEGAHADTEWVSLSGTVACARVLIRTARDLRRNHRA